MTDKTTNGAMAAVMIDNVVVGIFDSCSWSKNFGAEPVFILGRHSPAEIAVTSQEAISVNCSGFRIIGNGVHILPKVPKLQDLVNLENITIGIRDRNTGKLIYNVTGCKVVATSGGLQSKAVSRCQISYLGIADEDESGAQGEGAGAASLP